MPIGCFLDKGHRPTNEEVKSALGAKFSRWEKIIQFLRDNYEMTAEFGYGGKNYGWNLWYRKSGKSLVSLYPQRGHFVAQVVLGRDQVEQAMNLDLGKVVDRMVRETPQLHDGKWLFIPVESLAEVNGVENLLLIKRRPVKKKTQR
jgi:hypothetical protein